MKNDNLIRTWKDIAHYLQADVRTCIRWEQNHGLPIHRLGEEGKPSVFAYKDELDSWLRKKASNGPEFKVLTRHEHLGKFVFGFVLVFVLVIIATHLFVGTKSDGLPSSFDMDQTNLIVLNKAGKELWRKPLGANDDARDVGFYKDHFQIRKRLGFGVNLPWLAMKDIDHDGQRETIFVLRTINDTNDGQVVCYSSSGQELWRHKSGREMVFGDESFSGDYRILGFDMADLNADGNLEVILISIHKTFFPCLMEVLDSKGNVIGAYWNAGHFSDLVFVDINGDGRLEIVVGGYNNEYKKACLVVLDPSLVDGGSPQQKRNYICAGLGRGSELCYILFPRTDVDLAELNNGESIGYLESTNSHRLLAITGTTNLYYEFDLDFNIRYIHSSHLFENIHQNAASQGKVNTVLNDEYFERLKLGILYWDKETWASKPSQNIGASAGSGPAGR